MEHTAMAGLKYPLTNATKVRTWSLVWGDSYCLCCFMRGILRMPMWYWICCFASIVNAVCENNGVVRQSSNCDNFPETILLVQVCKDKLTASISGDRFVGTQPHRRPEAHLFPALPEATVFSGSIRLHGKFPTLAAVHSCFLTSFRISYSCASIVQQTA